MCQSLVASPPDVHSIYKTDMFIITIILLTRIRLKKLIQPIQVSSEDYGFKYIVRRVLLFMVNSSFVLWSEFPFNQMWILGCYSYIIIMAGLCITPCVYFSLLIRLWFVAKGDTLYNEIKDLTELNGLNAYVTMLFLNPHYRHLQEGVLFPALPNKQDDAWADIHTYELWACHQSGIWCKVFQLQYLSYAQGSWVMKER